MDRLQTIEAFVAVADAGSFAAAAQQLRVAKSVVTSRVQQLEEYVGAPLLHRTTRSVKLTELGEAYVKEFACLEDFISRFHVLNLKSQGAHIASEVFEWPGGKSVPVIDVAGNKFLTAWAPPQNAQLPKASRNIAVSANQISVGGQKHPNGSATPAANEAE
eukprot:gene20244-28647_t